MKNNILKTMSVFIVFLFLLSTMATTFPDNTQLMKLKTTSNSSTSVVSGKNAGNGALNGVNNPATSTLANQPMDLSSNSNIQSLQSSTQASPGSLTAGKANPLLGYESYANNVNFPSFQALSTSGQPLASSYTQGLTEIQSWGNITKTLTTTSQNIASLYPSDLLVKINTNDKIEFVIKLQNMNDLPALSNMLSYYNIQVESKVPELDAVVVWVPLNNVGLFRQIASTYPSIGFVEPNGYVHVQFTPNDPLWSDQWGPQLIGMTTAWDHELGNRTIKVAVIDTGIDYNNPELINNYLPIGYNWVANNSDPMDDNGHGTHVSGTIAAAINNGIGIAGLANVSIFAEKFLDSGGFGSDVNGALAINDAVAKGANILSNSWGGTFNSSLIADAVANAVNSGAIFVAAAGNLGANVPFFPADLPGVIGVGATDSSDQIASFSDYGNYVDISAPGVNILSTYLNDQYVYLSGTSMATPHVSGLLALLMSKYPNYTNKQLENLMYSTAVDLGAPGWDPYYGYGRIDASSAIFGLQDHNLNAYVQTPSILPVNLDSTADLVIRNIGLNNETNINYQAYLNGTQIASGTIASLLTGATTDIPVTVHPLTVATYNITLAVSPVPGETVTSDNIAMKYVQSATKQIDMQVGDILSYSYPSPDLSNSSDQLAPFDYAFNVTGQISPTAYNVDYIAYENLGGAISQPVVLFSSTVNPYTREMTNAPWGLFPYWINTTGLIVGDKVDLFTSGGQEGTVVGTGSYDYYGVTIPILVINDSFELVYFDQQTGIVISDNNLLPGYPPYFTAAYINVHPSGFNLYNLKGVIMDVFGAPGSTTQIYFLVMNTGTHVATSNATLTVNGTSIGTTNDFTLNPGAFLFLNLSWSPTSSGVFDLELAIPPIAEETYLNDNYLTVTATASNSHIISYVYDANTGQPVANAEVDTYDANNFNLVDSGFTDSNGYYESANLPPGSYIVEVSAQGYYGYGVFIVLGSGDYYLYIYLTPVPPRVLQILSPTTGQTVEGGQVVVDYYASDIYNAYLISITVNGTFVGTSYLYPSGIGNGTGPATVIVPVFGNGTNEISLTMTWYDGSTASSNVTINSDKVTPMFYPKPGDFLNYYVDLPYSGQYELLNFTFNNWLSNTEINVTISRQYFPVGSGPDQVSWFGVNVLNGFIDDPFYIANGYSFDFMSYLGYTNPQGHGAIGDKTPNNTWADIVTITGTGVWNGYNAWTSYDPLSDSYFYFNRLSGLLMSVNLYSGQVIASVIGTSFPLSAPPPTIQGLGDVFYQYGTTGHSLNWNITGSYPDVYAIFFNGFAVSSGKWQSGEQITFNVDGLPLGTYTITLSAQNVGGYNTSNVVTLHVINFPQLSSPPDITYKIGQEGARIAWNATGSDPNTFSITRNDTFVASGSWRPGVNISIAVDVLPMGTFSYKVVISDIEGVTATDTVLVTVLPPSGRPTPGFDGFMLFATLGILGALSILYKKKNLPK